MLKSVLTKNFKKLDNNFFEFTDGLNIISGDNFSGKTTLTQAIAFALFGVRVIPGAANKIPTWGQKDCLVDMNIGEYRILRSLKNCTVHKGNSSMATGVETCNDYIEKHITGTDYKGFQILNWSAQGETAALLTMGAAQLQRDVEKFSGVAFIDEMIKLANVDLRDATRETKLFVSAGTEEELAAKIKKDEAGIAKFRAAGGAANKTIRACESYKEVIEKEIEDAERNNRTAQTGAIAIATLEQRLKTVDENISQLSEAGKAFEDQLEASGSLKMEDYQARQRELKLVEKVNDTLTEYQTEIVKIKLVLNEVEVKIKEDKRLAKVVAMVSDVESKARKDFDEAGREFDCAALEVERLQAALDSGVCNACGQNIAKPAQIKKHKAELVAAAGKMGVTNAAMEKARAVLTPIEMQLDRATSDYDHGFGMWEANKVEVGKHKAKMETYLDEHTFDDSLEASLEELQKSLEALAVRETHESSLRKIQKSLATHEEDQQLWGIELADLKAGIPEPVSQDILDRFKSELKKWVEEQNEAVDSAHQAEKNEVLFSSELKELRLDLEAELKFRDQVVEVKVLTDFTDFLKDSRVKFLSTIWSGILSVASDFLMRTTDGNITAVSKSDKEGFLFCEDGVYAPVESASGAQRAFIGVGVRLALAKCLRSACELVVLDEPTESMREDNALRLSGGLLGRGQVLMVTHRESDKLSASNIIEL